MSQCISMNHLFLLMKAALIAEMEFENTDIASEESQSKPRNYSYEENTSLVLLLCP